MSNKKENNTSWFDNLFDDYVRMNRQVNPEDDLENYREDTRKVLLGNNPGNTADVPSKKAVKQQGNKPNSKAQ